MCIVQWITLGFRDWGEMGLRSLLALISAVVLISSWVMVGQVMLVGQGTAFSTTAQIERNSSYACIFHCVIALLSAYNVVDSQGKKVGQEREVARTCVAFRPWLHALHRFGPCFLVLHSCMCWMLCWWGTLESDLSPGFMMICGLKMCPWTSPQPSLGVPWPSLCQFFIPILWLQTKISFK